MYLRYKRINAYNIIIFIYFIRNNLFLNYFYFWQIIDADMRFAGIV